MFIFPLFFIHSGFLKQEILTGTQISNNLLKNSKNHTRFQVFYNPKK
jgi:hypothetical protein